MARLRGLAIETVVAEQLLVVAKLREVAGILHDMAAGAKVREAGVDLVAATIGELRIVE